MARVPAPAPAPLTAFRPPTALLAPPAPEVTLDLPVPAPSAVTSEEHSENVDPLPADPFSGVRRRLVAGDPGAARSAYEDAIAAGEEDRGRVLGGLLALAEGNVDEARTALAVALTESTDDATLALALLGLSVVAGFHSEGGERIDLLERAQALDRENNDVAAQLAEAVSATDDERAEKLLRAALARDSSHLHALLVYGRLLTATDRAEESLSYFDRAVADHPDEPFAHADRARARSSLGDDAGAVDDFTSAIALDPDYPWHLIDRGKISLRRARYQDAISDFSRALAIEPTNLSARVLRGRALFERRELPAALSDYETALQQRPDYRFGYPILAVLSYAGGKWEQAREMFDRSFESDESEYAYVLMSALSSLRMGRDGAAQQRLDAALRELPRDSWYYQAARTLRDAALAAQIGLVHARLSDNLVRSRLGFYLAESELRQGNTRTAYAYFLDSITRVEVDFLERALAEEALAAIGVNESPSG